MVRTRPSDSQPEYNDRQEYEEDAEEIVEKSGKIGPKYPIQQPQVQIVEREVSLSLLNQKLNHIISVLDREFQE